MFINSNGKKEATITDTQILGFFGPTFFLSNFATCPNKCTVFGPDLSMYPFATSEHTYMAFKTKDPSQWKELLQDNSPFFARKYGREKVKLRSDWDQIRITAMEYVLFAKFSQNPTLLQKLLQTGDKYLEETNDWGDTFWGVDWQTGVGENHLGKTLMKVRQLFSFVEPNSLVFAE